jgi:uncharacterized membrane protein YphA (DoxX/SURF4 family)
MTMLKFLHPGRLALSWVFLFSGFDVLRHPDKAATTAGPFIARLRERSPVELPDDVTLVRLNAATQVVAGTALATGVAPRLAAGALIGSLVPTTVAGHAFWIHDDPAQRTNQRNHFNKNLGLIGGLIIVVLTGAKRGRT